MAKNKYLNLENLLRNYGWCVLQIKIPKDVYKRQGHQFVLYWRKHNIFKDAHVREEVEVLENHPDIFTD